MGEITEALRRAREQRSGPDGRLPAVPVPAPRAAFEQWKRESVQPVPRDKRGFWQARAVVVEQQAPLAERYRHLALKIRRQLDALGTRSVVVTSAVREEGKTVTACNLALALASVAAGRRVALVDLDLRRHSVAAGLGLTAPAAGIEAVLQNGVPLAAARVSTDVGDLDVFPAACSVQDAHELLARPRLAELAAELETHYALVVCDSPPVLPVPDVPLILPHFGSCIAVARAGATRRSSFQELLSLMPPGHLLGSVLNDAPHPAHPENYAYYRPREADADEEDGPEGLHDGRKDV